MANVGRFFVGCVSLAFPSICVFCSERVESGGLCTGCEGELPWIESGCPRCGCPGVTAADGCKNCRDKHFAFERLVVPWDFEGRVQDLLHGLKYEGKTYAAPVVGRAISSRLTEVEFDPSDTLLVPVPLHRARLRERGYNQSRLLADELAQNLGMRRIDALKRTRPTDTQTALGLTERVTNVSGAFAASRPDAVRGKSVMLVDDVCTTGATVNACTEVLLAAGCQRVVVTAAASPYRSNDHVQGAV